MEQEQRQHEQQQSEPQEAIKKTERYMSTPLKTLKKAFDLSGHSSVPSAVFLTSSKFIFLLSLSGRSRWLLIKGYDKDWSLLVKVNMNLSCVSCFSQCEIDHSYSCIVFAPSVRVYRCIAIIVGTNFNLKPVLCGHLRVMRIFWPVLWTAMFFFKFLCFRFRVTLRFGQNLQFW